MRPSALDKSSLSIRRVNNWNCSHVVDLDSSPYITLDLQGLISATILMSSSELFTIFITVITHEESHDRLID